MLREISQAWKPHTVWLQLYIMFRTGKFIKIESSSNCLGLGVGKMISCKWAWGILPGGLECSKNKLSWYAWFWKLTKFTELHD